MNDDTGWIKAVSKMLLSMHTAGHLAVDVFFVLSGFVICYSLRGVRVTGRFFVNFMLRRSIRLDPPYWLSIVLVLGVLGLQAAVTKNTSNLPPIGSIVAHVFYLQEILGYPEINIVNWTLCLEIQFYLTFCLALALIQFAAERSAYSQTRLGEILLGVVGVRRWRFVAAFCLAKSLPECLSLIGTSFLPEHFCGGSSMERYPANGCFSSSRV